MIPRHELDPRKRRDALFETILRLTQAGKLTPENPKLPDPEHFLGQNFSIDPIIMGKMANLIQPDSTVIEVGSGPGVLTEFLAERAQRLIGIELDQSFAPILSDVHDRYPHTNFVIADALHLPLPADLHTQGKNIQIVSNLPFNIAGEFMGKIAGLPIKNAVLLLGRSRVPELHAKPDSYEYGHISAITQTFFDVVDPKINVGVNSFYPKATTTGKVVVMTPKKSAEIEGQTSTRILSHIIRDTQQAEHPIVQTSISDALPPDVTFFEGGISMPGQAILLPKKFISALSEKTFFGLEREEVRKLVQTIQRLP
jgi:16S rRNA A1518/A1519 N6-dimethyltransferase RsmA/KsgA/DIM1 with predicted DNA glycosylase/AP lyase activity